MTKETLPYPRHEHYIFPRNQLEQVQDELRLYPTGDEFRDFTIGLQSMYSSTAFMRSIKEYGKLAGGLRTPDIDDGNTGDFNYGFYEGALLALHMNIAPARKRVKKFVFDASIYPDDNQYEESTNVEDLINSWAGEEEQSWREFFDAQSDEYRTSVFEIIERLYDNRSDPTEKSYDFTLGYTFSSNIVWSLAKNIPPSL